MMIIKSHILMMKNKIIKYHNLMKSSREKQTRMYEYKDKLSNKTLDILAKGR